MSDFPSHDLHNNPGDAATSASHEANGDIIPPIIVDEYGLPIRKADDPSGEKKSTGEKLLDRVKTGERWMILFTAIVAGTTVCQSVQSCNNNASTAKQVNRIICAANQIGSAADKFRIASEGINGGVSDAVDRLSSNVQQARRLADDTEQSLHVDERAYISLVAIGDVPKVNEPSFPTAILRNTGKTNALRVRGEMAGYFTDKPDREERVNRKILRGRQDETAGEEVESPGVPFAVGGPRYPPDNMPLMPQENRNLIMSGQYSEVVYGRVDYYDIFGVEHWFTFCQYAVPNGKWAACTKYNEADSKLE